MEPPFQRRLQITSNFVLAEVHSLIVNRCGPLIALRAVESILDGATMAIQASESDQQRAIALLRIYADKGYSMVDAISFAIMERMNITTAFTVDRHFIQHGFRVLGLEE
jgi:predicted nucleic acid-binding protein